MRIFLLVISCLTFFFSDVYAQKKDLLTDKDEIEKRVKETLDLAVQAGDLKEFALTNKIKGEYIFDITVDEKGKVMTVYVVSGEAEEMAKQNLLKSKIKEYLFNFKMPKGSLQKCQYTFNF